MKINGKYINGVLAGNANIKFHDGIIYDGEVQKG